jgi:hypothetical protein
MSKNNRRKGHVYERYLAKLFRALGYEKCKTSREASRLYDNCGYDLWGIPFLVQAKAGYKKSRIRPDELFLKMERAMEQFPEDERNLLKNYPKLVFNKLDGYKDENHIVSMMFKDFVKLQIELSVYKGILSSKEAEELYGQLL